MCILYCIIIFILICFFRHHMPYDAIRNSKETLCPHQNTTRTKSTGFHFYLDAPEILPIEHSSIYMNIRETMLISFYITYYNCYHITAVIASSIFKYKPTNNISNKSTKDILQNNLFSKLVPPWLIRNKEAVFNSIRFI